MLSIGRPIGTTSGTDSTPAIRKHVANVVVSVGPYPSTTTRPAHASNTRRTAAAGTTSPPVHTSRNPANASGASCATTRNKPEVNHNPVTPNPVTIRRNTSASTSPAGATTTRPPRNNGTHNSYVDASNANGECTNTRSCPLPPNRRSNTKPTTSRCRTPTPFGTPVDPDVYSTYAKHSGSTPTTNGSTNSPESDASPSNTTNGPPWTDAAVDPHTPSVTTTDTPACPNTNRIRSTGARTSTGTYAPPAFNTASTATTISTDRSTNTPTRPSGRTPRRISRRARRLDH